jgi:hypothetical protein
MATAITIFDLRIDRVTPFDGSPSGVPIQLEKVAVLPKGAGVRLTGGTMGLGRSPALDGLQSFTVDVTVTPDKIGPDRQNIIEAQTPGVALFLNPQGRIVGSVNTAAGWVGVESEQDALEAKKAARIRFSRDEAGMLELRIEGKVVGSKAVAGPLVHAGLGGFRIGTWVDGKRWPFIGQVASLQISHGAVDDARLAQKRAAANRIEASFRKKTGLMNVSVNLLPDVGRSRLQPIKDLVNAAGVERLSDLDTLRLVTRTAITPGKVMVAPRKGIGKVDWTKMAKDMRVGDANARRGLLARHLTNRNSSAVLKRQLPPLPSRPIPGPRSLGNGGELSAADDPARTSPRLPTALLRESPTLKLAAAPRSITELVKADNGSLKLIDPELLEKLEGINPARWPVTSAPSTRLYALMTIPVGSAVIIAGTLDLTETELVIEPTVKTLYIIAERVVCGANARITWRRPGGTTPSRADDPALDGRGWSGVHTSSGSRDGLDGEDGRSAAAGLAGAIGEDSPDLEIWVKEMTAMPNLDLAGEDGRKAGKGQRGGRGGNGADGRLGERVWFFGWHCTTDPGDGGDGGNGGSGGRGGSGRNGGDGGRITIAVLDGTLESTVTSRAFKIKNAGGQPGRGGDGGDGGAGGRGGRSGAGETCRNASNGRAGAQGQPGAVGSDGSASGGDGDVQFFEFTQEAWDELLTRPWLSELVPTQAFPGDRITLRGSRFGANDRVVVGATSLVPTINADESISITLPLVIGGGEKTVFVRRPDGTESNRLAVWVKPQLDPLTAVLNPGADVTLKGRAFLNGASVLVDGAASPGTFVSAEEIRFTMAGTGGVGSVGGTATLQVRNPDGLVSNSRTAQIPRILEIPFRYGTHNLSFPNFDDGIPSWGTYEQTFGSAEVWHELLDPVFGHPVLTAAYYLFYEHFLKGEGKGGLATGFCTSLASLVADRFWQGRTDTVTIEKADVHEPLTAVHGKLLSRESLIHFHDQGREGVARVDRTYRDIEATLLRGTDRQNAPLLFFIPTGAIWDSGYLDKLADSHCVMPYRFAYPPGHPGPELTPDGSSTLTDPDGVQLFVWDCNEPTSANCRLVFRRSGGRIAFDYFDNSTSPKFRSEDGITLGFMTNGDYMLADHDLPFGGPFGLTRFVIDFLLSPADLQVTDGNGLRTGNFGGQIFSEIPDSHPCYLAKGAYLLPESVALTRRIVGTGVGSYAFHSIMPQGGSLALEGVPTSAGQEDVLAVSADSTQIRFTPGGPKAFALTLARQVGPQARAVAVSGVGGAPAAGVDVTASPDLSLVRVGNRGDGRQVDVKAFAIDETTNAPVNKVVSGVNLPSANDLVVMVPNWSTVDLSAEIVPFG